MVRDSFIFYKSWLEGTELIADETTLAKAILAVVRYGINGKIYEGDDPIVKSLLTYAIPQIDANNKKYSDGKKGGRPKKPLVIEKGKPLVTEKGKPPVTEKGKPPVTEKRKPNVNENENENENKNENDVKKEKKTSTALTVFHPPTVEEVQDFINQKGYLVDAETFVGYYESNGWMVGRNKMKNWKGALVTWNKKEKQYQNTNLMLNGSGKLYKKQSIIDSQRAVIRASMEEENRKWLERQGQGDGGEIEDISAITNN